MTSLNYYEQSAIEPIELMANILNTAEFEGFIKGNMLKYSLRAPFKGQSESDRYKARWYKTLLEYLADNYDTKETPTLVRDFKSKVKKGEIVI